MPADPQPLPVRCIRDVLIPMQDGVRVAATLYLPEADGRYPGIFSYYPYLKDGWIGLFKDPHYRYFAGRGYAVMQVDFRGTGASEGRNPHPFDVQERQDGHDIVEWMAAQPWCTGSVGIWGYSYGGITALSIASTQPPHLRAIVPIHATYDNYEWLLRTHGCRGLLLADVDWGTRMAACNLLPPVVRDEEGRWTRIWHERLDGEPPWFMDWHGEPPAPDFWLRRRIPLSEIEVPTFAICGWHDAYTAPAFRIHREVSGPTRVLIGPWKHALPDLSPVSPIGGVHEMTRWWDRWLKGVDNDVEKEPPITIHVQGAGAWRHETEWPIDRTEYLRLHLADGEALGAAPPTSASSTTHRYDSRIGTGSIGYNGHRLHLPIPDDQSFDDHASAAWTGRPLEEDLEVTGEPRVHVVVSADVDELTLVAKLCVVSSDGRSRVISRGNANPARADAHARFVPLAEGERRRVGISMHPVSTVVRAGERLRLCLAGSDFPELWPTSVSYTLRIRSGPAEPSWIEVPTVPPRPKPLAPPSLEPARTDLAPPAFDVGDADFEQQFDIVHRRLDRRVATFETRQSTRHRLDDDTVLHGVHGATVRTDADRPGETNLRTDTRFELRRPAGTVTVEVESRLTPFSVRADAEIRIDNRTFWKEELEQGRQRRGGLTPFRSGEALGMGELVVPLMNLLHEELPRAGVPADGRDHGAGAERAWEGAGVEVAAVGDDEPGPGAAHRGVRLRPDPRGRCPPTVARRVHRRAAHRRLQRLRPGGARNTTWCTWHVGRMRDGVLSRC